MRCVSQLLVLIVLFSFSTQAQITAKKIIDEGGSGPYPALAISDASLPNFTIYLPQELNITVEKEGRLPLLLWANGGCKSTSIEQERFLNEIASQGYIVLAIGALQIDETDKPNTASPDLELLKAIEWARKVTSSPKSRYYQKINLKTIAAAGHSCGGNQVLALSGNPEIATYLLFNSGIGDLNVAGANKEKLTLLNGPILYLIGGPNDPSTANAELDFSRIKHVKAVLANALDIGHEGTFQQRFGGSYTRLAVEWLDWQLKAKTEPQILTSETHPEFPNFRFKHKNW